MPVIYTLVSHGSQEGLSELARRVRRTAGRQPSETVAGGKEQAAASSAVPALESGGDSRPAWHLGQWVLMGLSVAALGVSVWSMASRDPGERVVVQQKVVEKTVTVTAGAPNPGALQTDGAVGSSTSEAGAVPDASTSTTITTAVGQEGTSGQGSQPGTTGASSPTGGSAGASTSDTTSTSTTEVGLPAPLTP